MLYSFSLSSYSWKTSLQLITLFHASRIHGILPEVQYEHINVGHSAHIAQDLLNIIPL